MAEFLTKFDFLQHLVFPFSYYQLTVDRLTDALSVFLRPPGLHQPLKNVLNQQWLGSSLYSFKKKKECFALSDNWPWPQISTPSLNLYSRFRPPNPYPYMPRDCMHKQIKRTSKTATWPGGGLATQLTIPDSLATGSERLDTDYVWQSFALPSLLGKQRGTP